MRGKSMGSNPIRSQPFLLTNFEADLKLKNNRTQIYSSNFLAM